MIGKRRSIPILLMLLVGIVSAQVTGTDYTNIGSLWIYSFIFPALAIIFTVCAFHFKTNFMPSMYAGFTWFICTFTTRSIVFIDDYTVSFETYNVETGNPEYNWIFMGLGLIMLLYGVIVLLINLKNQGIKFEGEKDR
jgi:hypothetical protein